MSPARLIVAATNKVYRLGLASTSSLIPFNNRRLAQQTRQDSPYFLHNIDLAIENGICYFLHQENIHISAYFILLGILTDTEQKQLRFLDDCFQHYCREWIDPHIKLLVPDYNLEQEQTTHPNRPTFVSHNPVENLMLECLYCANRDKAENLIQDLEHLDDDGNYGTTHKLLGSWILQTHHDYLKTRKIQASINSCIEPMQRAQETARFDDLFAERLTLLQWIDRSFIPRSEWILRITQAQRPDGGWMKRPSLIPIKTNQHSSALALAALIQYKQRVTL